VDNYLGPETSPGCKHAESQREEEEVRDQKSDSRRKKEDISRQRSERRRQKEVNKDLQDAINSFIIH